MLAGYSYLMSAEGVVDHSEPQIRPFGSLVLFLTNLRQSLKTVVRQVSVSTAMLAALY